MSIQIFIDNSGPSVSIQGSVEARIDPSGEILVLTYQALKGAQGSPGSDANVYEHEDTYDHGDLHEHDNKWLLDNLSYTPEQGIMYDGHINLSRAAYITYTTPVITVFGETYTIVYVESTEAVGQIDLAATTYSGAIPAGIVNKPGTAFPGGNPAYWQWETSVLGCETLTAVAESGVFSCGRVFGLNLFVFAGWKYRELVSLADSVS